MMEETMLVHPKKTHETWIAAYYMTKSAKDNLDCVPGVCGCEPPEQLEILKKEDNPIVIVPPIIDAMGNIDNFLDDAEAEEFLEGLQQGMDAAGGELGVLDAADNFIQGLQPMGAVGGVLGVVGGPVGGEDDIINNIGNFADEDVDVVALVAAQFPNAQ
jgi:hypothetical protein